MRAGSLVLAGAVVALAACRPPPPVYIVSALPEEAVTAEAPPAPLDEVPSPAPAEGYVWQPGYWHWGSEGYEWTSGQWLEPRQGYVFVAASYRFDGGVWRYRPCHWIRRPAPVLPERIRVAAPEVPRELGAPVSPQPAVPERTLPEARRQAPPAPDVLPRRAPPAPSDVPIRRAPAAPDAAEEIHGSPLPSADESAPIVATQPLRRGPVIIEVGGEDAPDARPPETLRQRPDFRGERAGRMVFGDDPTTGGRYRTDATGAIVLAPERGESRGWGRRERGGSLILATPPDRTETPDRGAPGWDRPRQYHDPTFRVGVPLQTQADRRAVLLAHPAWNPAERSSPSVSSGTYSGGRSLRAEPLHAMPRESFSSPAHRAEPTYRASSPVHETRAPTPVYSAPTITRVSAPSVSSAPSSPTIRSAPSVVHSSGSSGALHAAPGSLRLHGR
ncbi:MAG: YXWGXW repeat-containing protein [Deltaproteobacteria bacterium]|nr:YXWGXW repeat-containing protein [Deltaproteobacteria bacterium]